MDEYVHVVDFSCENSLPPIILVSEIRMHVLWTLQLSPHPTCHHPTDYDSKTMPFNQGMAFVIYVRRRVKNSPNVGPPLTSGSLLFIWRSLISLS